MNKIADYDTLDYDYSTYWKKREYENRAEQIVLNKLLKEKDGIRFIDIGGSYGRLTDLYYDKYKESVIVDYSLKTLQNNFKFLKDRYPDIQLIAANAYHLPFKDNSFDGGLMVRVLHHIEKPEEYFKEANRIFTDKATYIQEFANKTHLKAVIKSVLKGDLSIFDNKPYQQPDKRNNEGAREGSQVPFLNYTTSWISDTLSNHGFTIKRKIGCSYFRINLLKKYLGTKILVFFETLAQKAFSWSNISPSIFLETSINKNGEEIVKAFQDILVCPKCKSQLVFKDSECKCKQCNNRYQKKSNIWDFRI